MLKIKGKTAGVLPFKDDWWIKFKEQLVTLLWKKAPKVRFPSVCTLESIRLVWLDHGFYTGLGVVVGEEQLYLPKLLVLFSTDKNGSILCTVLVKQMVLFIEMWINKCVVEFDLI